MSVLDEPVWPACVVLVEAFVVLGLPLQQVDLGILDDPLDVGVKTAEVLFGLLADDFFGVFLLVEVD